MTRPTATATLVTRQTIVELRNHPQVRAGHQDAASADRFTPAHLVISTDYEGRPARLLSVTVTATDHDGHMGRWSSVTRHPVYRLDAVPESLRTIVLAFEPDLHPWVEPTTEG